MMARVTVVPHHEDLSLLPAQVAWLGIFKNEEQLAAAHASKCLDRPDLNKGKVFRDGKRPDTPYW